MSNWSSFCFKNREQLQQIQNISGNNRTFIFKPITKEFGKHFKKDVCRIGIKTFTLKNKCGCKYCKNVPNSIRLATIFFITALFSSFPNHFVRRWFMVIIFPVTTVQVNRKFTKIGRFVSIMNFSMKQFQIPFKIFDHLLVMYSKHS